MQNNHIINDNPKRSRIFLALIAVSVFAIFEFGAYGGMNLGFTLSYFLLFALSAVYFLPARKNAPFAYFCGFCSLAFAAAFTVNSSGFAKFLCFAATLMFYALFVGGVSDALLYETNTFRWALNVFYIPFCMPFFGFSESIKLISGKKDAPEEDQVAKKRTFSIGLLFVGLLLSLPALGIIVPLLAASDAAFDGLTLKLFRNVGEYVACLVLTLLVFPFVFSALYKLKLHDYTEKDMYTKKSEGSINISLLCGFLGMISLIYFVYIFSQLAYLSSGFMGILPENYSHADYARRGFFEMCAITVINLVIIAVCTMLCRKKDADSDIPTVIKVFSGFFCFFDLFIISTAISKMVMYIGEYGLTQKRVYVSIFMLMLAVVFICVGVRLINRRFRYITVIVVLCSLMGITCVFADVDRVIASYNISAYESEKISSLDVEAIGDLSEGAVPELYELYKRTDNDALKEEIAEELDKKLYKLNPENERSFKYFNISHSRAIKALEEYEASLPSVEE